MSLLFVANQFKTPFYLEVSRRLEDAGETVAWLTPSRRWRAFLEAAGVERDRILCTGDFAEEWAKSSQRMSADERIHFGALENDMHTLNSMLEVDRAMSPKSWAIRERHLAVLSREIPQFLSKQGVTTAISEYTWPIEQVTALACSALGATFLTPATIRVPSSRFGFMIGGGESHLLHLRTPAPADYEIARGAIEAVRAGGKPYYVYTTGGFIRRIPHWIKEAAVALGGDGGSSADSTVIPLTRRLLQRAKSLANVALLSVFRPFELPRAGEKFVLLTLHVQPEASIDTLARAYRNQVEGVRAVARLLPADVQLYVKEHSAALGTRPNGFYDELCNVPGVKLIDPAVNSRDLMDNALLVLAPSGTICMEAALIGVRATTFVELFFSSMLVVPNFNPYSASRSEVFRLLSTPVKSEAERTEALAQLVANSFEGLIDDPITSPHCMEPDNIHRVAEAILAIRYSLKPDLRSDG